MTRKEYESRLAELQTQIDELKNTEIEEEIPKPPHPRWKPKPDEQYYTIHVGCACAGINTWDSDNLDGDIYSLGFVFKTEAETEFAIERLKVIAEMREWAGKWNDKYSIAYVNVLSGETRIIVNDRLSTLSHGEMRFATKEDAENCIKAVGEERLKKYYFMVLEDEADDD
jgi:hypothetical protein